MSLPTDDKARKALPIFRGPMMYFPDALLALAAVCKAGNDQHNPGEPLHWAREKSTEQMDTAVRHLMDHGTGTKVDTDGMYHLAKAAWRILAELQLTIEEAQGRITRDKNGAPQPVARREARMDPADEAHRDAALQREAELEAQCLEILKRHEKRKDVTL